MAIQPVLRMGDPFLLDIAEEVSEFGSPELYALIENMLDTMRAEAGVGLAAPQIGVGLRVVVFGFEDNPRYPDALSVPQTVLINPVIEPLSEEMEDCWEGCLSVPGMRGIVPRYTSIHYKGFDADGSVIEVKAKDFHARVVQHECDHLDGILYPRRIKDFSSFGFIEELQASGAFEAQPCDDE